MYWLVMIGFLVGLLNIYVLLGWRKPLLAIVLGIIGVFFTLWGYWDASYQIAYNTTNDTVYIQWYRDIAPLPLFLNGLLIVLGIFLFILQMYMRWQKLRVRLPRI